MEIGANIQSIAIANGIGIALLVGLLFTSHMTRERRHLDDRLFTMLIFVCAGSCILETATWLVDGKPGAGAHLVNLLGNTYLYLANNVYAYLWVLYVDMRLHKGTEHIHRWHLGLLVPCAALVAVNLVNVFVPVMFSVDESNVYRRLPLSYLNYVMTFACLFYSIWLKRRFQKTHGTVRFFPLLLFLAPIFIGAILQALFYGISLAWPSVCIGLACIHMSLQNELSYVDPLTNLYNRAYLDYALGNMAQSRESCGGIMMDIDSFKEINDTYGHSVGDQALCDAARLLTQSAPENALVTRFAGDEFIVLLKPGDERQLGETEKIIQSAVDAFNRAGTHPYRLSFSMGHAPYTPGQDDEDSFLHRIDDRMYATKRAKYRNGELAERHTR